MQLLSALWAVQHWARTQKTLRLYSSSLLLAYDARRLKNHMLFSRSSSNNSANTPNGSISPASADGGKITPSSIFQWPQTGSPTSDTGESIQLYKKVQRNHSTQNNYDEVCFIQTNSNIPFYYGWIDKPISITRSLDPIHNCFCCCCFRCRT